jgi:hypothetical protein
METSNLKIEAAWFSERLRFLLTIASFGAVFETLNTGIYAILARLITRDDLL